MFLIRETAMKILSDVYQHCDSNLRMNPFNSEKYAKEIGDSNFIKAMKYLQQSGCIEPTKSVMPDSVTITAKGIDKAEDFILDQQE